jgi:hypothetical protein
MSISPQLGREHRFEIPAGAISHRACGISSLKHRTGMGSVTVEDLETLRT